MIQVSILRQPIRTEFSIKLWKWLQDSVQSLRFIKSLEPGTCCLSEEPARPSCLQKQPLASPYPFWRQWICGFWYEGMTYDCCRLIHYLWFLRRIISLGNIIRLRNKIHPESKKWFTWVCQVTNQFLSGYALSLAMSFISLLGSQTTNIAVLVQREVNYLCN